MNILMLTPYLPFPLLSGGQIRSYNLIKSLSSKHDITLFALIKDESEKKYLPELSKYCRKIEVFKRTFSPWHPKNILRAGFSLYPFLVTRNLVSGTKETVEKEIRENHYDLIHAETFYMMPNIPKNPIPVILVEQTIEYLGYQSYADKSSLPFLKPFFAIDILKIKLWEKHYWESCNFLITMSEDDKQFIKSVASNVKNIDVVANGVDVSWFNQTRKKLPENPTILFVGTFKWLPNSEAVDFLVNEVWPLIKKKMPLASLLIVGNSPTTKALSYQQSDPSIIVTGGIPDIRDAYAKAHVLLAPVFSGKGTRYKILEAMATGTPAIGTKIALEGLDIIPGKQAIVANTAQEMANSVYKVVSDVKLQKKLAKAGKEFVAQKYDWKTISQKLDGIYRKVANL
ncbi:MAG: Glycosyl transferase group 1 [Microgenomates group bacterium Gr01-1014_16]|nr:MAG: Glycosyl transferase group 1 [Microgenomates group bacterium Gr01-1014_16]